jgi:DNA-directed RNA polymerase specialized sigma24 family protein
MLAAIGGIAAPASAQDPSRAPEGPAASRVAVPPPPLPSVQQTGRPVNAVLIEKLCGRSLLQNEEDRLMGTISLMVRSTIKYQGGVFSPDLIDDAVQEASAAIEAACPKILATDDPHRLGMVIEIARDITSKLLRDTSRDYSPQQLEKATAADLSQELSTPEIDAWLDGLPPRQRAVALFLYASDVQPSDVAAAIGLPADSMGRAVATTKINLLQFFRDDADSAIPTAAGLPSVRPAAVVATRSPSMEISAPGFSPSSTRGSSATGLRSGSGPRSTPPAAPNTPPMSINPAPADPAPVAAAPLPPNSVAGAPAAQLRITGISPDIYSGWSLLATATGLPREQSLEIRKPFLLEPDARSQKRMIVTGAAEITDPGDNPRRFLLKAFAIDADREGAGLRSGFHLGAPRIDNAKALATLRNGSLSSIEMTRCLWHDYGAPDPGLCQ